MHSVQMLTSTSKNRERLYETLLPRSFLKTHEMKGRLKQPRKVRCPRFTYTHRQTSNKKNSQEKKEA